MASNNIIKRDIVEAQPVTWNSAVDIAIGKTSQLLNGTCMPIPFVHLHVNKDRRVCKDNTVASWCRLLSGWNCVCIFYIFFCCVFCNKHANFVLRKNNFKL